MRWLIAWAIGAMITVGVITAQHYKRHAPGDQVAFWLATLVTLIVALVVWPWQLWRYLIVDARRGQQMRWPDWRKYR